MQRREMPGNKADGAKMACSREGLVPEGNLVIVEKCAVAKRRVAAQAKPSARAKRSGPKAPRARTKQMHSKLRA